MASAKRMAALTSDADPREVPEFTSLARMIYDVSGNFALDIKN